MRIVCPVCKQPFCSPQCADAAMPAHMDSEKCADRLARNFQTQWRNIPVPGPADGIEVAVLPPTASRASFPHTERVSAEAFAEFLAHPAAIRCAIPAALGFPLVVAPFDRARDRIFGLATADSANNAATKLVANWKSGFAPGKVVGTVVALRADRVGFTADPEWCRLDEAIDAIFDVYSDSPSQNRHRNGLPTKELLVQSFRDNAARLKMEVESCTMQWRGTDADPIAVFSESYPLPCSACGAPNAKLGCSACHAAVYCNAACQRAHWTVHKTECRIFSAVWKQYAH